MTRRLTGRSALRLAAALVGACGLVAAAGATATAGTPAARGESSARYEAERLPGVPEAGSPDGVWQAWAAADRQKAASTDWAAAAAARGCVLTGVQIIDEVDVAYNRAMGAPADLVTTRVDTTEDCSGSLAMAAATKPTAQRATTTDGVSVLSVPGGTQCAGTNGPGTICIYKGGGLITTSWEYRGSGSVSGFLRIYQISTSSSGCPTGGTWHTGPSSTWSTGQTRSTSKTQTQNGGYSAHIWKQVLVGHSDWGSTCAVL